MSQPDHAPNFPGAQNLKPYADKRMFSPTTSQEAMPGMQVLSAYYDPIFGFSPLWSADLLDRLLDQTDGSAPRSAIRCRQGHLSVPAQQPSGYG